MKKKEAVHHPDELKLARLKKALAPGIKEWQEGRFVDDPFERINQRLDADEPQKKPSNHKCHIPKKHK